MVSFDLLASSLVSDSKQAQLLLEVGSDPRRRQAAQAILLEDGEEGIAIERIGREDPAILLVRTNPDRARRLVITLTENGFTRLKSIYPARPMPQEAGEPESVK